MVEPNEESLQQRVKVGDDGIYTKYGVRDEESAPIDLVLIHGFRSVAQPLFVGRPKRENSQTLIFRLRQTSIPRVHLQY